MFWYRGQLLLVSILFSLSFLDAAKAEVNRFRQPIPPPSHASGKKEQIKKNKTKKTFTIRPIDGFLKDMNKAKNQWKIAKALTELNDIERELKVLEQQVEFIKLASPFEKSILSNSLIEMVALRAKLAGLKETLENFGWSDYATLVKIYNKLDYAVNKKDWKKAQEASNELKKLRDKIVDQNGRYLGSKIPPEIEKLWLKAIQRTEKNIHEMNVEIAEAQRLQHAKVLPNTPQRIPNINSRPIKDPKSGRGPLR